MISEEDLIRFEEELMAFLENQLLTDDPFVIGGAAQILLDEYNEPIESCP